MAKEAAIIFVISPSAKSTCRFVYRSSVGTMMGMNESFISKFLFGKRRDKLSRKYREDKMPPRSGKTISKKLLRSTCVTMASMSKPE